MQSACRIMLAITVALVVHGSSFGQMIVAHRGASYDAPENTVAAFQLAWQQNSDGIEGDFYLTSDGKIVCIHDKDTTRTTGGTKLVVEESTLDQLRQHEYGSWKDPKYKGAPIPTLEDVLKTVPRGKTFVIELKSKVAIAPVLAAELKRLPTDAIQILVITFDLETARLCKELMPSTPVHWLTRFEAAATGKGHRPTASEIAQRVRQAGVDGVGMKANRDVIDASFVKELVAAGCDQFHVWTVDSVDDARYFQSLGALGITTNRPALIGQAIRNPPAAGR